MQLGSEYLNTSDKNLVQYLTKKDYTDRLKVIKRTKTPEKLINNAKQLIREVFGFTSVPGDEDGLMERFKDLAAKELAAIERLLDRYENNKYPDKEVLDKGKKLFQNYSG